MTAIDNDVTGVLSKAFDVLDTFGRTRQALSLSDITRRSGLPKTTTHRILQQMLSVGAIERVGHRYQVGTRVFAVSSRSREATVRDVALPHLTELNRRYGHTVHLATLCDADVLYIEKLQSRATAASPSSIGGRLPAHCTAAGKVLMAWGSPGTADVLRERRALPGRTTASITSVDQLRRSLLLVREHGFARDEEEAAVGLRCLAVPVQVGGQTVAAISIAHSSDLELPRDGLFALQETAARVGRDLYRIPGHLDLLALDGLAG
jgi:DNA-binding IclR family transcriptional regulator